MIKSIRLQNFFGFQDCTINLEKGENVLVGINGSGKSNFFKAIRLLKEAYNGKLASLLFGDPVNGFRGFQNILHKGIKAEKNDIITLTYAFDLVDHTVPVEVRYLTYQIQIVVTNINNNEYSVIEQVWGEKDGEKIVFLDRDENSAKVRDDIKEQLLPLKSLFWTKTESLINRAQNNSPAMLDLAWCITSINCYENLNIAQLRQGEVPKPVRKFLSDDFSDAISFFEYLEKSKNENEQEAFKKITEGLKKVNDNFKQLKTLRRTGVIELWLSEENLLDENALNISDGTLRFFCLLLILYNPFGPDAGWVNKIICIDEPELGLHPDMLHTLYEAIKYAAQTSQIIISTHSPLLLDWFDFENVRVFEKNDNNATIVKQLDREHYKGWYDTYMLGDMWLKGDIGGKRW